MTLTQLKEYFIKRRQALEQIQRDFVVVVSVRTADGGKEGVMTEVSRENAAHLLAEGRARLADASETEKYYEAAQKAREEAEELAERSRIQVQVLSELSARTRKSAGREKR
ncbi:MAG: hypothetical protein NZV14_07995 [Bryobacteraceae bacterium]|nr:hypothetical protein [Bryobacteraceae bacterium]MDW8378088.1 hypothetical protein [Bryobacterales bacterium]